MRDFLEIKRERLQKKIDLVHKRLKSDCAKMSVISYISESMKNVNLEMYEKVSRLSLPLIQNILLNESMLKIKLKGLRTNRKICENMRNVCVGYLSKEDRDNVANFLEYPSEDDEFIHNT
jgi:hypothetical protein